jgi:hypothetical protein
MRPNNTNGPTSSHLAWAGVGALAAALWATNRASDAKKSRAEREHPYEVKEVCGEIYELLDQMELMGTSTDENDYVEQVSQYLEDNSDFEIETWPSTPEGAPDILIENLLALEFKYNPNKAQRDRCVGQCAGYSRSWATWIILLDAPASRIGRLEGLLKDKGLENIAVWNFPIDRR